MIVLLYHLCAFSTGIFLEFWQVKADKKLDCLSSFKIYTNYFLHKMVRLFFIKVFLYF